MAVHPCRITCAFVFSCRVEHNLWLQDSGKVVFFMSEGVGNPYYRRLFAVNADTYVREHKTRYLICVPKTVWVR